MSTSCPSCYKGLQLEDLYVRGYERATRLETCGRITVSKRGRVQAERVVAVEGVEVHGVMHANVRSGRRVVLAPGSQWRGDLSAPSIDVQQGALVFGGFWRILGAEGDVPLVIGADNGKRSAERLPNVPFPGPADADARVVAMDPPPKQVRKKVRLGRRQ